MQTAAKNDRKSTTIGRYTCYCLSVFSLAMLMPATPALAEESQSLAEITHAVQKFLQQKHSDNTENIDIDVTQLDSRLRLAACPEGLQTFLPPGGRLTGNISVGVRCDGGRPWSIYVSATVRQFAEVYVMQTSRGRGDTIAAADTTLRKTSINGLNQGYITDFNDIKGMQLKRTVSPGTVLTSDMLYRPDLLKRGEIVSILARSESIEIRMRGETLSAGSVGERIRVKNLSTNKIVEGTITSDGNVEVRL